jgi:hypothetical protein
MWDERSKQPKPGSPGPSNRQKKVARALSEELLALREELLAGNLHKAWGHRAAAWTHVDELPSYTTWQQRRMLGQYRILLVNAERRRKERRAG